MAEKSIEERVGILEYSTTDQERRIRMQEQNNKTLERISVLIEKHDERMDKQDEQFDRITNTLDKINENLGSLNSDVGYLKDKQDDMDNRVSGLEKGKQQELNEFKTKSWDFYLKVGAAVLIAGILFYFGWK